MQAKGSRQMKSAGEKKYFTLLVLGLTAFMLCSCSQQQNSKATKSSNEVIVRADVTLKPTLLEVAQNYLYVSSMKIKFQFAPSASVISDPPADSVDVYIFANDHYLEPARELNLVDSVGEVHLAYAVPGLIVPRFNRNLMITSLAEMKDSKLRIGIADPQSDVLGAFTVEMLKRNNIYESINHRLILTGPSALDLTERVSKCEIDVGVAWTMSTNWNPESFDVVLPVPNEIPRVAAITAVRAASPADSAAAGKLMTYLKSDRCLNIFRKWGYLINESDIHMYAPAASIGGKPEF
ncbi:MAG TPA: hypothetical protein ENF16_06295 [Bacteroidetes bacterium]|nr:hypothetical protein [Bacteroidota bacterium]